jgi:NADPH:quinone reductase-like Zn-dependent oxidoreductase
VRIANFSAQFNTDLLNTFARLIDEGQVKVHVSHTFPLSEAVQAQELSEKGHGRGRIVLHIA